MPRDVLSILNNVPFCSKEENKIEKIYDYKIAKIEYGKLPDKLKSIKPRINYLRYARQYRFIISEEHWNCRK